jgi:hypothetical protein
MIFSAAGDRQMLPRQTNRSFMGVGSVVSSLMIVR